MTNKRRMVKFITKCSPYSAGERAAFNQRDAQRLIDRRIAVYDDDFDSIYLEMKNTNHIKEILNGIQ